MVSLTGLKRRQKISERGIRTSLVLLHVFIETNTQKHFQITINGTNTSSCLGKVHSHQVAQGILTLPFQFYLIFTFRYKAMQEIPCFQSTCRVRVHHLTTGNQAYTC